MKGLWPWRLELNRGGGRAIRSVPGLRQVLLGSYHAASWLFIQQLPMLGASAITKSHGVLWVRPRVTPREDAGFCYKAY